MQTEEPKKNGGGLEMRPSVIAMIFTVCRVLCSGLRGQNWLETRCNIHSYMHKLCAYCLKKIRAEHSPGKQSNYNGSLVVHAFRMLAPPLPMRKRWYSGLQWISRL